MKKLFATFVFVLALISVTRAQSVTGKVVDVLDGRTLMIETSAGRVTVRLQYVEVPESGQPLFATIRDHLSRLSLGKSVEYKTRRLIDDVSVGRLTTFDGADLSLQMIRDGAAWHEPRATSDQNADEAAVYASNQDLAKSEKRGVWSGPGLKTPWEVRAENEKLAHAQDVAKRLTHPTMVGVGSLHSDTRRPSGQFTPASATSPRAQMDAWVNAFAGADKEPHGLQTYVDPNNRFSAVYTSALLIDFVSPAGKERLESRVIMVAPTVNNAAFGKLFLLGFRAISSDYKFSKVNTRLTMIVDGQRMSIGVVHGMRRDTLIGAEEIMYFRLSWLQLKKIGNAKRVEIQINKLTAPLSEDGRDLFKQLATATS